MGCCSSRSNDDGKVEYSTTNKDKICDDLAKKADMSKHFAEGWRLHHSFVDEKDNKKKKTFLTYAREADNEVVFKSTHFTISEEALLESVKEKKNYEVIFGNWDYLNVLSNNYAQSGVTLTDNAVIDAFLAQEKAFSADKDKSKVFALLRPALGITKEALTDKPKQEEPTKPKEDLVKPNEDVKQPENPPQA